MNFYLYIYPFVYVNLDSPNGVFLYNTMNGQSLESRSTILKKLIEDVYKRNTLGYTIFDNELLRDEEVSSFVEEIQTKKMGNILNTSATTRIPAHLTPILNLQQDIEKQNIDSLKNHGLLNYLNEINIYLNNICSLNCLHCNQKVYQFRSCIKNLHISELTFENCRILFSQIQHAPLRRINILGGNILNYSQWQPLSDLLYDYVDKIYLYIHYKLLSIPSSFSILNHKCKFVVLVTFPVEKEYLKKIVLDTKENVKYTFIIRDESEYTKSISFIDSYKITQYKIVPFYDGKNYLFFKDFIFMSKKDILETRLTMREIFRNQKLNSGNFGVLHILPTGEVKANLNAGVLGNIESNSILEIIEQELKINTAWRKVRNGKPCSNCFYRWLCPAPTDYELAVDKANLCHINNL